MPFALVFVTVTTNRTYSVRSEASVWANVGVQEPFWVTFKHDTGFMIGGINDDGEARVVHSYNDGYSEYNAKPLSKTILLTTCKVVRADNIDSCK